MMINWLVETLLSSTLLIITILLLRKLIGKHIGARWTYTLWIMPLLLLIMPKVQIFLPELLTPITQLTKVSSLALENGNEFIQTKELIRPANIASNPPLFHESIVIGLWLISVVTYWLVLWYRHNSYIKENLPYPSSDSQLINQTIKQLWSMLDLKKSPLILFSSLARTPFVFGVLNPKLVLPENICDNFSMKQMRMLLAHELIHLKRGDIQHNMLAQLFVSLFWFNPLVHIAFKAFKADQEKSCDELVIDKLSLAQSIHSYGQLLLSSALLTNEPPPSFSSWGGSSPTQTKERIEMLKYYNNTQVKHWLGIITISLVALVFLTNVSAHQVHNGNKDIDEVFASAISDIDNQNFKNTLKSLNTISKSQLLAGSKSQLGKYYALKTIAYIQLNEACNAKKSLLAMQGINANTLMTKQAEENFAFYRSKSLLNTADMNCMLSAISNLNDQGQNHKLALDLSINFGIESNRIIESDVQQLIELGLLLSDPTFREKTISIIGHTDSYGGKNSNLVLSEKRANVVLSELERIQPSLIGRLKAIGQGELKPLFSNETERGRAINRRVEVLITN